MNSLNDIVRIFERKCDEAWKDHFGAMMTNLLRNNREVLDTCREPTGNDITIYEIADNECTIMGFKALVEIFLRK